MALVTRTLAPKVSVFPLEIPTQTVQQNSGFPRAVVNVDFNKQVVTAAGAGNTLQIYVTYELPKNFAYIYLGNDQSVDVTNTADADEFYTPVHRIGGDTGSTSVWDAVMRSKAGPQPFNYGKYSDPVDFYQIAWYDLNPTKDVIFNTKAEPVRVKSYVYSDADTSINPLYSYRARFLQIDLSQAYSFPVNYTIPTR